MKKLLQINSVVNTTSTGRIAEGIGIKASESGWKSIIAFGRYAKSSQSNLIKIGNGSAIYKHVALTRIFDAHGLGSVNGTKRLIKEIEKINPDIIHLHNLHGYYLNIKILFHYLSNQKIPVIWTLHDCWAYTGHCVYYSYVDCQKWQTKKGCHACPQKRKYPSSYVIDGSQRNFKIKKKLFTSVPNLTLVPVSNWLSNELKKSFLKEQNIKMIHNGIDLKQFRIKYPMDIRAKYKITEEFIILGVASLWSERKGLKDFFELSKFINADQQIVLVGLNKNQIKTLPKNIIGIERTDSIEEMTALYNSAGVFVNPTWEDNYPTTNMEAIACGTPVITYDTGGSPESVSKETGFVITQGDIEQLKEKIDIVQINGKAHYSKNCRIMAEKNFDKEDRFQEYLKLYQQLL